jgi:hypothetical protein
LDYNKEILSNLFTVFKEDKYRPYEYETSHENKKMTPKFLKNMPVYYKWITTAAFEISAV